MTTEQIKHLADALDHLSGAEDALQKFKGNFNLQGHEVDAIRFAKAHVRKATEELNNLNT